MSAAHRSARPKGYIEPNFRPQTYRLIEQVNAIIDREAASLPLTARQVFYMLVGQYAYDKTEQAYARLCEAIVKGRRAGIVSWSAIRDDGTVEHFAGGYDNPAQWWSGMKYSAKAYARDRNEGQPVRIELWCEAAGMAPQLASVARPYGVPVFSTGGFSSVTVTKEIADRVVETAERDDKPTVFLHVGDYDPSGESIFNAMSEDVAAFVWEDGDPDWWRPRRVALTAEHVRDYALPTAPAKKSDTRSRNWSGQTCQLEALRPKQLAALVVDAIEAEYDLDMLASVKETESVERDGIIAEVDRILEDRK